MLIPFDLGCDIINLSLGTGNNWPEDASAVVSERIASKGTVGNYLLIMHYTHRIHTFFFFHT
jgi:hypothetical protein